MHSFLFLNFWSEVNIFLFCKISLAKFNRDDDCFVSNNIWKKCFELIFSKTPVTANSPVNRPHQSEKQHVNETYETERQTLNQVNTQFSHYFACSVHHCSIFSRFKKNWQPNRWHVMLWTQYIASCYFLETRTEGRYFKCWLL